MSGPTDPALSLTNDQRLLKALAETTTTAIFVYRDRYLYVNPAGAAMSGYSVAELLEMPPWKIVHPDDREMARQRAEARLRGEDVPAQHEVKILRPDGSLLWVDFSAALIDFDGQPAGLGTAVDITERKLALMALRESEERLNLAQKAADSVTWEWDPATDRLEFSDFAEELFSLPLKKLIRSGADFIRLAHPDDQARLQQAMRHLIKGPGDLSIDVRAVSPRGEIRWLAEKAVAIRDESGWTQRVIGVAHDITDRKIAEQALFQEKERADVTLASIADGVIRTDAKGAVDYMNPVAQGLTGWVLAEAYGLPAGHIYTPLDPDTGRRVENPVELCLTERRERVSRSDRVLTRRDGKELPIHDSVAPLHNREGDFIGTVLVLKDLSRIREAEKEMDRIAAEDPLTGLPNRREFEGALRAILEDQERAAEGHALLHIDLDRFKLINDTCGVTGGDQMLRQAALAIEGKVRISDLVARLGGDEFGVLLRECDSYQAQELAVGINRAISDFRFHWKDRVFPVTASTGLVPISSGSDDFDEIMSRAEAASHFAEEMGGNRVHSYQSGDTEVAKRQGEMRWISRLQSALEEDRFRLYHQVIAPVRKDADPTPFYELFIRLLDHKGEVIGPVSFIPAAERYGFISNIDRWVVQTALDLLAQLESSSPQHKARFAINLSGVSLGVDGFLDVVNQIFDRTQIDPSLVLFEITETAAISDLPNAMRFFGSLRERGCRFVLDDFGMGQSSLSYLKTLPVDFLKIDGEFVRNIVADPVQAALVRSIKQIAEALGLQTIAESVEDQEALTAVEEIGVDFAQGYFLDRPKPLTIAALQAAGNT